MLGYLDTLSKERLGRLAQWRCQSRSRKVNTGYNDQGGIVSKEARDLRRLLALEQERVAAEEAILLVEAKDEVR